MDRKWVIVVTKHTAKNTILWTYGLFDTESQAKSVLGRRSFWHEAKSQYDYTVTVVNDPPEKRIAPLTRSAKARVKEWLRTR